jgi:hypothetical protein
MTDRPQYDERSILEPTDEEVSAEMARPRIHRWIDEPSAIAMALGKDEIPMAPEPHYARKAVTWDAARRPTIDPQQVAWAPATFRQGVAETTNADPIFFDVPRMGDVMAVAFLSLAFDASQFRRAMAELQRAFAPEPRPWKVHQTGRFRQRARR